MTAEVVIDTNVAVVANGQADHVDVSCQLACILALEAVIQSHCVLLDSAGCILRQYRQRLSFAGQPGVGNAFFKWLWDNSFVSDHCRQVSVTPRAGDCTDFAEFPNDPRLATFDPADRRFVAVAIAAGTLPEILNAVDTDWAIHEAALRDHGVRVSFLCSVPTAGGS